MMIEPGLKTPITRSGVAALAICFFVGVAVLGVLFIFLRRSPGMLGPPEGGYEVYCYRDADGDGRGNPEERILIREGDTPPKGYTVVAGDCDDHDPNK